MNIRKCGALAVLLASAMLAGCATSRSELKIAGPAASTVAKVTKQRTVVIRSVRDERQFAEKPSDPSTPSLGFGGAAQAVDAVKARAIGRKRNSFGQALGDVLMDEGQTVAGVVRDNVSAAFRDAGYRVAADPVSAGPDPLLVDVRVKKFWSWITPGFMTITVAANIDTDVLVSDGGAPTLVSVTSRDDRMAVTESAWTEIVQKALVSYRSEAGRKFASPPF
jgi:hypothetical protein